MIVSLSIDSASSALWWSNIVYIGGAVLTLASAMHVRHEKRRVEAHQKSKVSFASEASVIAAAIVSLAGTAGAIYFGDLVGHLKDVELSHYQAQTGIEIANANRATSLANAEAATANQKAQEAIASAALVNLRADALQEASDTLAKEYGDIHIKTSDRNLQPDFARRLKSIAPSLPRLPIPVLVYYNYVDLEAGRFMLKIRAAMESARLPGNFAAWALLPVDAQPGIVFYYTNAHTKPWADAYAKGFTQAGLPSRSALDVRAIPDNKGDLIELYVGPKPY